MSTGRLEKYEYIQGPYKRYSSKYTWSVGNWYINGGATTRSEACTSKIDLNGTTYAWKLWISPGKSDLIFNLEFSSTLEIEVMEVTCKISDCFMYRSYNKPIPKHQTHETAGRLEKKDCGSHLHSSDEDTTLRIVTEITIIRECDINCHINPTAVSPMVFNTGNSLPPKLTTMLKRKTLCDVEFQLGDKSFYAHKVVLAAQSKVFEAMFLSGMKEQKDNIIEISNTTAEIFQQFLNYLYSEEVTGLERIVEEMIVIADFYNVSDLKVVCENVMLKSLSENTVIRYAFIADKLNCDVLKNEALCFIRNTNKFSGLTLLKEDIATITCLKELMSNNQPKIQP